MLSNFTDTSNVSERGCLIPESGAVKCDVGIAGFGAVGRGIARSFCRRPFKTAVWDRRFQTGEHLDDFTPGNVPRARTLPELARQLREPRTIFIVGETTEETDAIINELLPHLAPRDVLIDAGESFFKDAGRRARKLAERSVDFMCAEIAGGGTAAGERAMIMAGGKREVFERARPFLEALAGDSKSEPSLGYVDSAAAACFARMVHSGIEYALMQLISEAFDLMQRMVNLGEGELRDVRGASPIGDLNGYLADVSGHFLDPVDEGIERGQIGERLEAVKNSAAAGWIAQTARELNVPAPTLDAALGARFFSALERQRLLISTPYRHPFKSIDHRGNSALDELSRALYAATIITYAEGFVLLAEGSAQYRFHFDRVEIARLWKVGCGARSDLLESIATALTETPSLKNILCDEGLAEEVMAHQECLRRAVWHAGELDMVSPGLVASLDYLDFFRDAWLPVNLVQARPNLAHRGANREREALTMGL